MTPRVTCLPIEDDGPITKLNESLDVKSLNRTWHFINIVFIIAVLKFLSTSILSLCIMNLFYAPDSFPSPHDFIFCLNYKWMTESHF